MSLKNKLLFTSFFIGAAVIIIMQLDLVSFIASILNRVFNLNLPDRFFHSLTFRGLIGLIGVAMCIIPMRLYKEEEGEEDSEKEGIF